MIRSVLLRRSKWHPGTRHLCIVICCLLPTGSSKKYESNELGGSASRPPKTFVRNFFFDFFIFLLARRYRVKGGILFAPLASILSMVASFTLLFGITIFLSSSIRESFSCCVFSLYVSEVVGNWHVECSSSLVSLMQRSMVSGTRHAQYRLC